MIVGLYSIDACTGTLHAARQADTAEQLPLVVDLCQRCIADPRQIAVAAQPLRVAWLPAPVRCLACSFADVPLCVSIFLSAPAPALVESLGQLVQQRRAADVWPAQHGRNAADDRAAAWTHAILDYPAVVTVRLPVPDTRLFRRLQYLADEFVEAWAAACFDTRGNNDEGKRADTPHLS